MNSKEFSLKIESIVKEKKISHMDAVVWYCDENVPPQIGRAHV